MKLAVLGLAASGAALSIGVYVASPVLDSSAAETCPSQTNLANAIRLAGKDPRKVCDLYLDNQGHRALPPGIVKLTELKNLDVTNNKLETLPPEIGALTKLKRLSVRLNKLQTLPAELGNLKKIELLQLEQNQLTRLPRGFCGVGQNADVALIELALAQNKLASLPDDFGACHPLRFLNLSDNLLTTLPESFGQLTIDWTLDLRRNQLQALPDSFGQLTIGKDGYPAYLYFDDNKLTDLPVFGQNMHVLSLSLRNNRLEHLPQWFFEIPKLPIRYELRSIDLTGNPLTLEEVNALKAVFARENAKDSSFTGPEITFPYTYAMLAKLDDAIDGAWSRGELRKARELFTQWFAAAEEFRMKEPNNTILANYIAQMKTFSESLALEADYEELDRLYNSIVEIWDTRSNYEQGTKLFSDWATLAASVTGRDASNAALASWRKDMEGYRRDYELEAGFQQLDRGSVAIGNAWEQGDLEGAMRLLRQWLNIADALSPISSEDRNFLASWKRDMGTAQAELAAAFPSPGSAEKQRPLEQGRTDLDDRMAAIRTAVEAEEYEKALPLLTEWLAAAKTLLALDPSDSELVQWISDTEKLKTDLEDQ